MKNVNSILLNDRLFNQKCHVEPEWKKNRISKHQKVSSAVYLFPEEKVILYKQLAESKTCWQEWMLTLKVGLSSGNDKMKIDVKRKILVASMNIEKLKSQYIDASKAKAWNKRDK